MGYPYNLDFDFGALEGLNKFSINNLGDPFIESNYGVHSREFEVGGSLVAAGSAAGCASAGSAILGSAVGTYHLSSVAGRKPTAYQAHSSTTFWFQQSTAAEFVVSCVKRWLAIAEAAGVLSCDAC